MSNINQTLANLTNEHIAELRYNSSIPTDSWKEIDAVIQDSAQRTLNAANDIISRGLTQPIGLGTTLSTVDVASHRSAEFSMEIEYGNYDRSLIKPQNFVIPVIKARAQLGLRSMAASQSVGVDLPQHQIREAADACMELIEEMIFDGAPGIVSGSDKVLGLKTTAKKRNHY